MAPAQIDPIREYRRDASVNLWVGGIFGLLLILVGLVEGDWLTIVGAMLIVLVALRYWTVDLVPDRLIAERLEDRKRASPQVPSPPPH